ncbi:MAG: phosphatidylserine decarboxylase, partial [Calditerrivibrio sp.]|nr:phosphatidylserine decarboxylase [Calditerrivibrio sp.]
TKLLKFFNYTRRINHGEILNYLRKMNINMDEIYDDITQYKTVGDVFQRKIKYWEYRPMDDNPDIIVSPADSKMIPGSFSETSSIFIKDKFFSLDDLILKEKWVNRFEGGDFAVFRLTPDEYHYNHLPVSGEIVDIYEIDGAYHSCNPTSTVSIVTPLSMNKRIVTIIDTDVRDGSNVGIVAFVEVVAMMIGEISQEYSSEKYNDPTPLQEGDFAMKGQPKSLYKPGSSTDIVIFEKNKITFDSDILEFSRKNDITSRYTSGFNIPLVEIKVRVRERIGKRRS